MKKIGRDRLNANLSFGKRMKRGPVWNNLR